MIQSPRRASRALAFTAALLGTTGFAVARADSAGPATAPAAAPAGQELPMYKIPNIFPAAEAYYAPDDYHIIAQTQDPEAAKPDPGKVGGALTWIFTDDGKKAWRVNAKGNDACSYFFPDQKRIVWTSTKDNLDLPKGNWADSNEYPTGAELYTSDLDGSNIKRLTNNKYYEAEVSVSPDGKWIVFGRSINGDMDLWRMRSDGTDEQRITYTPDWQPGAPFYMPDNETIMFRAWRSSEYGKVKPTPMTVFTIKHDGTGLKQRTFDRTMNWAPYPAPDGRHYVFVRMDEGKNWEVYLGDLTGAPPKRLTFNPGFDGLPSLSKNGKKMLFARSTTGRANLSTFVMDMSSLDLGPANFHGIPDTVVPADPMIVTDFNSGAPAAAPR